MSYNDDDDFDNTPERDPIWDAEIDINRVILRALDDHSVTFFDELDSLARMDLLADIEDRLSISLPLTIIDLPVTIRQVKLAILAIYQQEWNT